MPDKTEISYESICKKLGFTMEDDTPCCSDYEDDSKPSPFSILTDEESDFLIEYEKKRLKALGAYNPTTPK